MLAYNFYWYYWFF